MNLAFLTAQCRLADLCALNCQIASHVGTVSTTASVRAKFCNRYVIQREIILEKVITMVDAPTVVSYFEQQRLMFWSGVTIDKVKALKYPTFFLLEQCWPKKFMDKVSHF